MSIRKIKWESNIVRRSGVHYHLRRRFLLLTGSKWGVCLSLHVSEHVCVCLRVAPPGCCSKKKHLKEPYEYVSRRSFATHSKQTIESFAIVCWRLVAAPGERVHVGKKIQKIHTYLYICVFIFANL